MLCTPFYCMASLYVDQLTPILVLQKTFVRLATFMDFFPLIPGPLEHTLINIFDIYKFQLGKLVFDSLNNIGPIQGILNFTRASEIHSHSTRFSMRGNLHVNSVRTSRFGLRSLNIEGGHLWATLPTHLKECSTKQAFNKHFKANLISIYMPLESFWNRTSRKGKCNSIPGYRVIYTLFCVYIRVQ